MKKAINRILGGALTASLVLAGTFAAAAPAAAQYSVSGAPGVADVSVVQGDVAIVRGDNGGQFAATVNTPLLPGDYISTAGGSRVELALDGISMLRLASNTQVRLVSLDPSSREMQLAVGTAELAELQGADGSPQIDTPSVSVRPEQTGDYRVSVLPNGQTLVTVRSGMATVSSADGSQHLTPGTTLVAYGDYNNPSISMEAAVGFDGFDAFNQNRDQAVVASIDSNAYLSPALSGYANFNNYGQWYNVPGYGESWSPNDQGSNWSPYSNGQWTWEPGYGYTWVGNEPWGYAPYHYGNWYYATGYNQWMWQPPAYQYQQPNALATSWLPALVAFFLTGGNPNAALGAAFNASSPYGYSDIGWVPLAPGEQYTPWYAGFGANAAYPETAMSAPTNVTNVYNVYRNIRYIHVIRVIPVNQFRNGKFDRPLVMRPFQLRRIAIVRGAVPIVPTKAVLKIKPLARPVAISSRFHDRVFTAKTPAIVRMASFDGQRAELQNRVSAKPRIVPIAQVRTAIARPAPAYHPPAQHRTIRPPVERVTPVHAKPAQRFVPPAQRATAAPERPRQAAPPARQFVPPAQRATTAPRHAAPPARQFVPPAERATTAPHHVASPTQRFVPPAQRARQAPASKPTPNKERARKERAAPSPPPA
ncbi:MAG TPA: DUF6600 domain-containing protein [Candidatus Baltobacteraceae bacterium]|nr:DUF6600 domain-containing protein [Candidatus Baltobacteraceae bacterium]